MGYGVGLCDYLQLRVCDRNSVDVGMGERDFWKGKQNMELRLVAEELKKLISDHYETENKKLVNIQFRYSQKTGEFIGIVGGFSEKK